MTKSEEEKKSYNEKWRAEHKEYIAKYNKAYSLLNKEKNKKRRSVQGKIYYEANKEKIRKATSDYYHTGNGKKVARKRAILNKESIKANHKKWLNNNPWLKHFYYAKSRCNYNYNNRYKNYGARGIQFKLTREEIKKLWLRDNAISMKQPSIDRKDSNGHYEYFNCQFIEKVENSKKPKAKTQNKEQR